MERPRTGRYSYTTMVILGLDPGGNGNFGWCLAEVTGDRPMTLWQWGTADNAERAVAHALEHLPRSAMLAAAGIDSPLFWVANGDRQCDKTVRRAMRRVGASAVGGTVQAVNAMRGACLIQGIMAARLLRLRFPSIRITESHPKALLWLLKLANNDRRVSEVTIAHLAEFIKCEMPRLSEHERDAAIGALAATAMLLLWHGWRDIAVDERDAFAPVSPVEYWMPVPEGAT